MKLKFKSLQGSTFTVEADPSDTVSECGQAMLGTRIADDATPLTDRQSEGQDRSRAWSSGRRTEDHLLGKNLDRQRHRTIMWRIREGLSRSNGIQAQGTEIRVVCCYAFYHD